MTENEALKRVGKKLLERRLGEAIGEMESFLSSYPHQTNADRLFAIKTDYQLMTDSWRRGFKDSQLGNLYDNLLQRMYRLYANTALAHTIGHSSFLSSVYMRVRLVARDWSPQVIKEELEAFVSDTALLELEPEHTRKTRSAEIHRRHKQSMSELFDYLWTSEQWTDGRSAAMEEVLVSPTIDLNDQQLIVSAVTLSLIQFFDMAKFRLLVHVYQRAAYEQVRQRALVGWVLALDSKAGRLYREEAELVEKLLEDEHCCLELTELQKQLIYCVDAEKDNETIRSEIMPDLLKNNNLRSMRNGFMEADEDAMADILNPGEAERNLEKVEASFQRMMDMQRQGSDIYFGGFSQMKRFPFFQEICNWFVPFYIDHPDISEAVAKFGGSKFLTKMLLNGPFCDSDKYSFTLAFSQVLGQIPQSMRQMLERGEAQLHEVPEEESERPAYIRRTYLQNLYRFFRLYPYRSELRQRFVSEDADYLFFANPIFSRTQLELHFNDMVAFLMKRKRMWEAADLLPNYGENRRDFQYYMMAGYLSHNGYVEGELMLELDPVECFQKALDLQPDNERAMLGYARAQFSYKNYEEALEAYDDLLSLHPDKASYLLNKAVCLTNLARYGEALQLLYRLNYDSPDDESVNRVLAWALTCDGRYEQAESIYGQLLSVEKPAVDDLLNYGYCLWLSGNIDEAADCFHRYLKESGMRAIDIIEEEKEQLVSKGITEPEMQMMLYIL